MPSRLIAGDICRLCHHLMNDPGLVAAMREVATRPELVEITAYARKYYMNEDAMLSLIGSI